MNFCCCFHLILCLAWHTAQIFQVHSLVFIQNVPNPIFEMSLTLIKYHVPSPTSPFICLPIQSEHKSTRFCHLVWNLREVHLHLFLLFFSYSIPLSLSVTSPSPFPSYLHFFIYYDFSKSLDFKCDETIGQIQIEGYLTKQLV